MKYFSTLFDIFLFETIFALIFSGGLFFFNDPFAVKLFYVSIASLLITILLGTAGHYLNLFRREKPGEEF